MKKIAARFLRYLKTEKGFTLIELLVVIGILGILAAGLLATIDPIEQFRKGQDSNEKTTALELVNSLTRYYSTHNTYPWDVTTNGGADCMTPSGNPASTQVQAADGTDPGGFKNCLTELINQGELKATFDQQHLILSQLYITQTLVGGQKGVAVCYDPASKSESARTETQYTKAGVIDNNCSGANKPTTCYWCAQ